MAGESERAGVAARGADGAATAATRAGVREGSAGPATGAAGAVATLAGAGAAGVGRRAVVVAAPPGRVAGTVAGNSSVQLFALEIVMIPPHTEQRARMPGPGTREGSTRKTE
jgi:hypothetical protein